MEYKYCENQNFEDYASGRVIYGNEGIPNFPVRLLNEIFGRALAYSSKKDNLTVYDPCCGGGYSLTVLGFCHSDIIGKLYGSDIDEKMTTYAKKNTNLLTQEGLSNRQSEVKNLYTMYQKSSHKEALNSIHMFQTKRKKDITTEIFVADCTKSLPPIQPDIILCDVPYGNLVHWNEEGQSSMDAMLHQLASISSEDTILAVCMDKKQRVHHEAWTSLEKQSIGKRRFEIFKKC